jgi:hypothetical protein
MTMSCTEAPGLVIEKDRLHVIGGSFLGIIGDENHSFGYHLCAPPDGDYSTLGSTNRPVGPYSCAIDIGMNWPASRTWLRWLIGEIREDRIQGIAEVIGSYDGSDVRYWSDDSGWETNGVRYDGEGHDTWTHVAVYRSTARIDHRLLAGWTRDGQEKIMAGVYDPYGAPKSVGDRQPGVLTADLWGQEQNGVSPYDGKTPSLRSTLIKETHDTVKEIATTVGNLQVGAVDVVALADALASHEGFVSAIASAVGANLAERIAE